MKRNTAMAALLAATIAATGLMVFYNLAMRESFAVSVGYTFPVPEPVSKPAAKPQTARPEVRESDPRPEAQAETDQREEPQKETGTVQQGDVRFPLELNAATYDELLLIPQVGDVMAQRILQYRDHLGGYTDLSQLLDIKGVGEKVYYNITAYLYLSNGGGAASQEEEST